MRTVVDPALAPADRRLLRAWDRVRALARAAAGIGPVQDRLLIGYFAVSIGAWGAQLLLGPWVPWAWAWFLAAVAAGSAAAVPAGRRAARRWKDSCVRPEDLSQRDRALLCRAQDAIGTVLTSRARAAGHLDGPGSAAVLASREWELARMLRELSAAAAAGIPAGGRDIVGRVTGSAVRRVEELEACAARVTAADAAFCVAADGCGARLLNLESMTAPDGQSSAELAALARDASAAEQSYRERG